MTVKRFNRKRFMQKQLIDALTCPINRDATRREHSCDDWALWQHPNWLLQHYIDHGGAAAFSKKRDEFLDEVTIPDEIEFFI